MRINILSFTSWPVAQKQEKKIPLGLQQEKKKRGSLLFSSLYLGKKQQT